MATYHFNAQVVSRSCGASAVAGAAYRSGECLTDERTGEEHDHTARDDLDATEILAPRESPDWAQDRARLWNAVEQAERRVDAQVAREIRVAIPRELPPEDGRALVRDYAQRSFVDRGMVADIAFHGGESKNPHAHIMLTTRTLTPEGFGQKNREWNKKAHVTTWRKDWADSANRALAQHGHAERIDHRTLAAQRDEALATSQDPAQRAEDRQRALARADALDRDPQVRKGRAAWMKVRTGEDNDQTRLAKEINARNAAREQERAALRDELRGVQQQIQQIQALIRRGVEKVKETVKGLVRGPQSDHADTPDEPPTAARPTSTPKPQQGGDRGADDDWMPGDGLLGRR